MGITRDFKMIVLFLSSFFMLLCACIYKDKIILLFAVVLGIIVLFFFMNNPVRLIYVQIFYNCFIKFAIETLNIPSSANYVSDIITILIVITAIRRLIKEKGKSNIFLPMAIVLIFFISTIIGLIINGQSVFLYTWGIRNNFRFYGFFFGCVILLKKKNIDFLFKTVLILSVVNVLFCTYQYFILGMSQDNLGGIFGINVGVNIYLNVFMCIVTVLAVVQFMHQKMSILVLIFTIFSNVYIAAIGEVKVFFIELIIIVASMVIFSKPSKKTFLIVSASAIGIFLGIQLFYTIFPSWENFFRIEKIIESGQSYSTKTDLGRFTATKRVTNMFLSGDISKLFFGLGLGSAETSHISMFTSQFYYEYGNSLHYTWLSQAFMLIENGWIGLTCFIGFFVSIIISIFTIKKEKSIYFNYCVMTQIFAVLSILLAVYNSTLRTEAGYFVYFMLSLPFALYRNEKEFNDIKVEMD